MKTASFVFGSKKTKSVVPDAQDPVTAFVDDNAERKKKAAKFLLVCDHHQGAKPIEFCFGEVVRCSCGTEGTYKGKGNSKYAIQQRRLSSAQVNRRLSKHIEATTKKINDKAEEQTKELEQQAGEHETKAQALLLMGAIQKEDASALCIQRVFRKKLARRRVAAEKVKHEEDLRKLQEMLWPRPATTTRFEFKGPTAISDSSGLHSKGQTLMSGFDTDGVLHWLATRGGKQPYANPHESGLIVAALSTKGGWGGSPDVFINHTQPKMPNGTRNVPHSWMSIDFGAGRSFLVEHYALRHGMNHGSGHMKHWRLEGSNDGELWVMIREHSEEKTTLSWTRSQGFATAAWEVKAARRAYRHFRIMMTGLNCEANHTLYCAGMELYGTLRVE
jgi:hypothetical protein